MRSSFPQPYVRLRFLTYTYYASHEYLSRPAEGRGAGVELRNPPDDPLFGYVKRARDRTMRVRSSKVPGTRIRKS